MGQLNLTKKKELVFKRVVNRVEFHDYDANEYKGIAGFMSKADVKVMATKRTEELSDSNRFQLGYDLEVTVTSLQYYSVFEFAKLRNLNCYVRLVEVPLWIGPCLLNVDVELSPGETKGKVTISGTLYVENLTDGFKANWNGAILEPYAFPFDGDQSSMIELVPEGLSWQYSLGYHIAADDPLMEFIDYNTPVLTDASQITEMKLIVVYPNTKIPIENMPSSYELKKFDGTDYQIISKDDYSIIFEDEVYKIHYLSATALMLKNRLLFQFTMTAEESS